MAGWLAASVDRTSLLGAWLLAGWLAGWLIGLLAWLAGINWGSFRNRNSGILRILHIGGLHIGREVVQLGGISGFHRIICLGTACGDSVFCSVTDFC